GNNSCGVHALMGGKTVDNIRSLDILLYDGTRMTVGATADEELSRIIAAGGRRGEIYAALAGIRNRYAPLIRERFPKIPRRVSGYNLDSLLPENNFHIARSLVGSEGTCVTVLSAELELMPSPPHRRLVVVGFADPFTAADNVPAVLEYKPIGLEGFDAMLTGFMRRKHLAEEEVKLLPEGKGYLLVEFGGWTPEDADHQASEFCKAAASFSAKPNVRQYSPTRPNRSGTFARLPSALPSSCPVSRTDGKAGKTPPYLPKSSVLICASFRRSWINTNIAAPCTATLARDASTCASTSIWRALRASQNTATSSTTPPTSSSLTEAHFPASMETASPAPRCCQKC